MIVGTFCNVSNTFAAQAKYHFAYITFKESGQSSINLVDPNQPLQLEIHPIDTQNTIVLDVSNSVTSQWLALSYSQNANVMRLINTTTWETRDIAQGVFPILVHGASGQFAAWSPNGNSLAFLMRQGNVFDAYMYSLADKKLFNLTDGTIDNESLVWSSDSAQLAVGSGTCNGQNDCNLAIDVFDASTHQRRQRVDLSKSSAGQLTEGSVCALAWSPNLRYLSFVPKCGIGEVSRGQVMGSEVFIWDLQTGKITALTNFITGKPTRPDVSYVEGKYHLFWYDAQTLLVGAIYGSNLGPMQIRTVAYQFPDGTGRDLTTTAIGELAINPASKELAFREVSSVDTDFKVKAASARTSAFNNGTLQTIADINDSSACDFSWSPDGAYLAYTRHTGSDCSTPVQSIVFRDSTSSKTFEQALPSTKGTVYDRIVPVGWVSG